MKLILSSSLLALIALATTGGVAIGQINYISQTRSVSAATNAGSQSFGFSEVGHWSQSAGSSNGGFASAGAGQITDLRPDAIAFNISAGAGGQNAFLAESSCILDTTFSLSEASPFELVRTGTTGGMGWSLRLVGVFNYGPGSPNVPLSLTGLLQPGQYRLVVSASGANFPTGSDMSGQAQGVLYIPTPGAATALLVGLSAGATRRRRS